MPRASTLRCSVCSWAIRSRRRIKCNSCENAYHVKCWKSCTKLSIATERATYGWQYDQCNSVGSEPVEHDVIRHEMKNILSAQVLNERYTEQILTQDDDFEYSPFHNIRDKYFDIADLEFTSNQLTKERSKYFMTMYLISALLTIMNIS